MPLAPGERLGPYEILAPAGAGGMGEVYKARDTRLDRIVAVKVLKDGVSERFEREAKIIAGLNHPNICTLHDAGAGYLVMEFIEGRPIGGPLPLDDVVRLGAQIARALDAAHTHGVVHRDLKPGNVLSTRSGVKIVDFGLAKSGGQELTLTRAGEVLGTPAYMAPEQWEGRDADARSDIYSFGCVLQEMVTGRRPAPGQAREPVESVALDRLIARCMMRDPDDRWQSTRDIAWELEGIAAMPAGAGADVPGSRWRPLLAMATIGLLAALAVTGWLWRPRPEARTYQVSILPPENGVLLFGRANEGGSAISPDGRRLAFIARAAGRSQLWVRELDEAAARPLPGTEDAYYPFWSPDSRTVGYFAGGKMMRIVVAGGAPIPVCDSSVGRGGTWSRDDVILFSTGVGRVIKSVAASGGTPVDVTVRDTRRGESFHYWPQFLPDGRHFLYFIRSGEAKYNGIFVERADVTPATMQRRFVTPANSAAVFAAPSELLFVRDQNLVAQSFDLQQQAVRGDARPVAERIALHAGMARAEISASANGSMAYVAGSAEVRMVWRDRNHRALGIAGSGEGLNTPRISPDGKRVAFSRLDPLYGNADLWTADLDDAAGGGARPLRLTSGSAFDTSPVWSADGRDIIFGSNPPGSLFRISSGGGGEPQPLTTSHWQYPTDWSRDGRHVLISQSAERTGHDVMVLELGGSKETYPFLQTVFQEMHGQFSPDGRWVAYQSDESGVRQVYVQGFTPGKPASGVKWQISGAGGGVQPRWALADEISFLTLNGRMMSVRVDARGDRMQVGTPVELFPTRLAPTAAWVFWDYDVSRDGRRFLMSEPVDDLYTKALTLVINRRADIR